MKIDYLLKCKFDIFFEVMKTMVKIKLENDLQINKKTRNHTGNEIRGCNAPDGQRVYYLQLFQILHKPQKEY